MKDITKKDLIKALESFDDNLPIRIGGYCDEVKVMRFIKIKINGVPTECFMLSRDEEDAEDY